MYLKIVEILKLAHWNSCKCHIIVASVRCWYHQTLMYIEKEHECVSAPGVNTVSNKCFSVFTRLAHRLTWQKHSVAQYKGGWVWHGIDFFLFVFWSTDWQHSGTASMCHHKLVSLSKLFSCLRRLCRFSPPLELLHEKQMNYSKHNERVHYWLWTDPDQRHAEIFFSKSTKKFIFNILGYWNIKFIRAKKKKKKGYYCYKLDTMLKI